MDQHTLQLLNDVNRAIIKFRGIYSAWSAQHNISYHEMLVFYTIREKGFCTQKQICDSYILPRQTMNNVITTLRRNGILEISAEHSAGREKAFVLTPKGVDYAQPLMNSMNTVENRAVELLGSEKLEALTALMLEYDQALNRALEESR
ncbi:MAG: winged helix-turn-helix transcriptional regulator [Clostridia bacterium]|nr:winged helix-turn-helix transcriptional regulator [Clostridia bacterium]